MSDFPPRPADAPPGYDEEDPYEGTDITELPHWWRRNIEIHRNFDLRPYRPPRFSDGRFISPVISELEAEYDINIKFRIINPQNEDNWEIVVNDKAVRIVEQHRKGEGYSIYRISSDEFRTLIREYVS